MVPNGFKGTLMKNCIISGKELTESDITIELKNKPGHWVLKEELLKEYNNKMILFLNYKIENSEFIFNIYYENIR